MPHADSSTAGQRLLDTATEGGGSGHRMQIFVKTTTGKSIGLSAYGSDSGASVKAQIQDVEGVPPNQQSLFFGKQQVEDDRMLSDYMHTVRLQSLSLHLVVV